MNTFCGNAVGWLRPFIIAAAALGLTACTMGTDFKKPTVAIPASFKEGATWQRSAANPQGAISSTWWLAFHDDTLTHLVGQSLAANASIASAEAAYRLSQAQVSASSASLFPIVGADFSGSRARTSLQNGSINNGTSASGGNEGVRNVVSATANVSWEPDFWGEVRRGIEASKETAEASDAQLAGERISIAASVATDYFALRTLDHDIDSLSQQQKIDARILEITQVAFRQGTASNDEVLEAQDTLEDAIANLQTAMTSREQFEHALAVLVGVPPSNLTIAAVPDYTFPMPEIPLAVPSTLLERRPDVIAAERLAAAANARIGVAKAAFFPTLDLSAQGGFQHNTLANLFSLPSRIWTIGPDLAGTIFDGGARTAAVKEAQATYDEQVANYRAAVLTAFQNVEDGLSSINHLRAQAQALNAVYQRNTQLFASQQAQFRAGTVSEQNVLTQQLTLLLAKQSVDDTLGQAAQSQVGLVKNLGGGWQRGT